MTCVRDTLRLSMLATQSVFGHRRVLLESDFDMSSDDRSLWINASTEVGQHLHQVFLGYINSEFGPEAFRLARREQAREPALQTV
jgi:hypothetical protein